VYTVAVITGSHYSINIYNSPLHTELILHMLEISSVLVHDIFAKT